MKDDDSAEEFRRRVEEYVERTYNSKHSNETHDTHKSPLTGMRLAHARAVATRTTPAFWVGVFTAFIMMATIGGLVGFVLHYAMSLTGMPESGISFFIGGASTLITVFLVLTWKK